MYVTKQVPDENSKMSVSYLYMTIKKRVEGSDDYEPDIRVPRTPSQKDLRTTDWRIVNDLENF